MVGVLVAAGVAVYALWPRGPKLEWYTSPRIPFEGKVVRVRSLVPVGWDEVNSNWRVNTAISPGIPWLRVGPKKRTSNFLDRLKRLLQGPAERNATIEFAREVSRNSSVTYLMWPTGPTLRQGTYQETRRVGRDPVFRLTYSRDYRAEFNATYRQICDSFQVIREK
jgi:hypothetical protein